MEWDLEDEEVFGVYGGLGQNGELTSLGFLTWTPGCKVEEDVVDPEDQDDEEDDEVDGEDGMNGGEVEQPKTKDD